MFHPGLPHPPFSRGPKTQAQFFADEEAKAEKRATKQEYMKWYNQQPKVKAAKREYEQREEAKATRREYEQKNKAARRAKSRAGMRRLREERARAARELLVQARRGTKIPAVLALPARAGGLPRAGPGSRGPFRYALPRWRLPSLP